MTAMDLLFVNLTQTCNFTAYFQSCFSPYNSDQDQILKNIYFRIIMENIVKYSFKTALKPI